MQWKTRQNLMAQNVLENGTEIVLILLFASDEMIRMVNMFLEIFFMDVTCCTNHQNKPLFLMVIKDANGETQIGYISVLSFEKKWVFNEMSKRVFVELYGENTIHRNFLMLTDKDSAVYEPIMDSIATRVEYQQSKHMLSLFHAIAKNLMRKSTPNRPIYQEEIS